MAPLNLPPPALTLEQATELASSLESSKTFQGKSFNAATLEEFLTSNGFDKKFGKTTLEVGQALLDHRLAHHVTDDDEFTAEGDYILISQESAAVKALHATFNERFASAEFSGKVRLQVSRFFGLSKSFQPVYAILTKTALYIYKRQSAASEPIHTYPVSKMADVKECMECGDDWSGFTIKNKDASIIFICADHSKRQEGWMTALTNLGLNYIQVFDEGTVEAHIQDAHSLYEFKSRRLNTQEPVDFSQFKGDVCLVVNVSSNCGLTPQYKDLEALYEKYKDKGFRILAFPVNQFANQEPGTEAEIEEFVTTKYHVTFDMLEKTECNGKNAHPVFRYVKSNLGGVLGSSVKWNFTKFLCDKNGVPIKRYAPTTNPKSFEEDIVQLLEL